MNNSTIDEIRSVLRDKWWSEDNVRDDSDIFETLVLVGDDCVEFMDKFSERFDVNLDGLLRYFHYEIESVFPSIGHMFYPRALRAVERIPITLELLAEAAEQKKWIVTYPEHTLPNPRYASLIDLGIVIALFGALFAIAY